MTAATLPTVSETSKAGGRTGRKASILIFYDPMAVSIGTVREHLNAFRLFTGFRVQYASGVNGARLLVDLDAYDAVVVHYSVRVAFERHMPEWISEAIASYRGLKILFAQDEYDFTETTRRFVERVGIDMFFTCVPPASIDSVYPKARFRGTEFVPTLTGYVPNAFLSNSEWRPIAERPIWIGYRGRELPPWYGDLGRDKVMIARKLLEVARARGIAADIAWTEDSRIYGEEWYAFIRSCRAMLGTESGSNVFDETGELREAIQAFQTRNPSAGYDAIWNRFLSGRDGQIRMNQISPRLFEAIGLGTPLILVEGEYSGILTPGKHYIALCRDFSNVDEVMEMLKDESLLEGMRRRAFDDIVATGRYSYQSFGAAFVHCVAPKLGMAAEDVLASVGRRGVGDAFAVLDAPLSERVDAFATFLPLRERELTFRQSVDVPLRIFARHYLLRKGALPQPVRLALKAVLPRGLVKYLVARLLK